MAEQRLQVLVNRMDFLTAGVLQLAKQGLHFLSSREIFHRSFVPFGGGFLVLNEAWASLHNDRWKQAQLSCRSIGKLQRKPEPSRGDVDNNITVLLAKSSPLRMFCAAFMIAHFRLICPDAASICMLLTQPLLS